MTQLMTTVYAVSRITRKCINYKKPDIIKW